MIVVIGGGIAYGATYAFGLITGNEPSVQRLEEPVSGAAGRSTYGSTRSASVTTTPTSG